eukprot:747862-Hanusia_phi.AAC.3
MSLNLFNTTDFKQLSSTEKKSELIPGTSDSLLFCRYLNALETTCLSTILRTTVKKPSKVIFVCPSLKQHNRSTGHRNIPLRKALQDKDFNAMHVKDTWKELEVRTIFHEISFSIKVMLFKTSQSWQQTLSHPWMQEKGTFLTTLSLHRVEMGWTGSLQLTELILKHSNCYLHTLHCFQNNLGDNGVLAMVRENREVLNLTVSENLVPSTVPMRLRREEDDGFEKNLFLSNQPDLPQNASQGNDLTSSSPSDVVISKSTVKFSPTLPEISTMDLQRMKSFREKLMEEAALCEKEIVKGRESFREKLLQETLIDLHSKRMEGCSCVQPGASLTRAMCRGKNTEGHHTGQGSEGGHPLKAAGDQRPEASSMDEAG